jgi:class 3 adenylate cyclase
MGILERIENRVALPGDSEMRRSQKVLAAMIFIAAGPMVIFNAIGNFSAGLNGVGWVFLTLGIFLIACFFTELYFPQFYIPLAYSAFMVSLVANLLAHLFAGGTTSGNFNIGWAVLTPLLAVLLVDRHALTLTMIPFMLVVIGVVVFEPWALEHMPQVDPFFMLFNYAFGLAMLGVMIALASLYLVGQIENYRRRADELLLNILPGSIAIRLKENPETIADDYSEVSVLFADIVDFTGMSSDANPVDVVNLLNDVFSEFDDLAEKHGLEKIKTIGDAYMAAAGLPEPRADHVEAIVGFAIDMLAAVERCQGLRGEPVRLRIGINTGSVVAGVIGRQKFIYDLWGDAVNVASRMESNGLANQIQVTQAVKDKLDDRYTFVERDPIPVKGKGMMVTYLLVK